MRRGVLGESNEFLLNEPLFIALQLNLFEEVEQGCWGLGTGRECPWSALTVRQIPGRLFNFFPLMYLFYFLLW